MNFWVQVVPFLLKFVDNLTNVYVRFNRKRLKGRTGEDDSRIALSTLYYVSRHFRRFLWLYQMLGHIQGPIMPFLLW